MKYIKLFEELKYTPEHKKLIQQLRYKLNKFFGRNCCGVTKLRFLPVQIYSRYAAQEYLPYTGSTMLFSIYVPSHIYSDQISDYNIKIEEYISLVKDIGLIKEYDLSDTKYYATEDQMRELISRMKYMEVEVAAKKYNI
jgi:hypothetical protein